MKKLLLPIVFLLMIACQPQDDFSLSDSIEIQNLEWGSSKDGHSANQHAYRNRDMHLQAQVVAEHLVKSLIVTIVNPEGDDLIFDYSQEFAGIRNPFVHKHPVIPADFPLGTTQLIFTVIDQNGAQLQVEHPLTINPEIVHQNPMGEYEAVKLYVSYSPTDSLDIIDLGTGETARLGLPENGVHFLRNLKLNIGNVVAYGAQSVSAIYTGLDFHINHYHLKNPDVALVAHVPQPDAISWGDYCYFNALTNGDLYSFGAEDVFNGQEMGIELQPTTNLPMAKKGIASFEFDGVLTDEASFTRKDFIFRVKPDNQLLIINKATKKTETAYSNFGEIYSATHYKWINADNSVFPPNYTYHYFAVYATEKGIKVVTFNYTNKQWEVQSLNDDPKNIHELHLLWPKNKPSEHEGIFFTSTPTLVGQSPEGIYQISFDEQACQLKRVISQPNIEKIAFCAESNALACVNGSGAVKLYHTDDFSSLGNSQINGLPSDAIIAFSKRFFYMGVPGENTIQQYDIHSFEPSRIIQLDAALEDFVLAGNIQEVEIFHGDDGYGQ